VSPAGAMDLVFDFAGVIFHWQPQALLDRLLPGRGVTAADFFQGYDGDWADFDRGLVDPEPLSMRIAMRTDVTPIEAQQVIAAVPEELRPDAEMVALIEELHGRGAALHYISNMPMPYADVLEARWSFLARFRHGLISGRVGLVKPEPAIFERAELAFGLKPAGTLFFDDVQVNVVAASARGWNAVRWESAAQCRAELAARGLL
jgi:putative hydrolase of the HAD superfamily